ncbi:uncharacterized protein LOC113512156 isoform X2 [Galleria mellonella]|uniref:Uncharacterized protein LOC113512156 isoform X2 n=1 Tax=Galleria mellonella TaxID=7137 RepID=A0A6J3BZD1_GALME|nr:uncharacterized protein LOC113512156 isoform X2 [Galleria mellonella]
MEFIATDESTFQPTHVDNKNSKENDSVENFQKFIYDLFEKNGVLNDLRAYLRGHIIDVLKSAQTGDPSPCQRHFTQRLELTYQALNILIAEYLFCLEFSYSLSVFISEIPLANMVFAYAKALLHSHNEGNPVLKFTDGDVWSILNYLGVKCDSEHAYKIVELYKSKDNLPLLLCILKCMPMYNKEGFTIEQDISSLDSISSVKSSDTVAEKTNSKNGGCHEKCKHYVFCRTCQNRMSRVKDKYMKKRKKIAKMFQQLKSVYEAEVEMVRVEEDKKTKRTLATHIAQLQRHHVEMEEAFKAREAKLEKNVEQKKRFLWGLARQLREQHAQLSRAMLTLRGEADRLTAKEDSLKTQLLEAETVLKKRGEEMRAQISNELVILEGHLESMKKERESINRERLELQSYKTPDTSIKHGLESEDLKSHYDLLKDEFLILKKYLETIKMEPKCVIERETITDLNDVTSKINIMLNNEEADRNLLKSDNEERARAPNIVINDLKKQKNVNFSQSNLDEVYRQRSRDRSRSSASSEAGEVADCGHHRDRDSDCDRDRHCDRDAPCCHMQYDVLQHLRNENESLKDFARQQRTHINDLMSQQARLQAELIATRTRIDATRPRTAPDITPRCACINERLNMSESTNTFGWRKGAGEEVSVFSEARPRVVVPGDILPFVGALRDTRDGRRHLINTWRSLRRGTTVSGRRPAPQVIETTPILHATDVTPASPTTPIMDRPTSAAPTQDMCATNAEDEPNIIGQSENITINPVSCDNVQQPKLTETAVENKTRAKSPKSMLREAKQKLKNKNSKKVQPTTHEKSPNTVLREAKLRLRKLEIEAEAVERSYLDFRKRQNELIKDRKSYSMSKDNPLESDLDNLGIKRSKSLQKIDDKSKTKLDTQTNYKETLQFMKTDFNKYLCEYKANFDIKEIQSKNRRAIEKVHPNTNIVKKNYKEKHNYLETPLIEFRKFYHSQQMGRPLTIIDNPRPIPLEREVPLKNNGNSKQDVFKLRNENIKEAENYEELELQIQKNNLNKIYNLPEQSAVEPSNKEQNNIENSPKLEKNIKEESNDNVLRVVVENVSETSELKLTESQSQELLLVVQSSVDASRASQSDEKENMSTRMTIIVSPRKNDCKGSNDVGLEPLKATDIPEKSVPEEVARLTQNDVLDTIFHADPNNQISSTEMQLDISKEQLEDSISEYEKEDDYVNDFSADVDNYNSRSEYENNSPISLPKTSEDENFWET